MIVQAGLIVSRLVHYAGVLGLFGMLLFPFYAGVSLDQPTGARVRSWSIGLALLALIGGGGWFVFTTAAMAGDLVSAVSPPVLMQVLTATDFGPLWLARLGLLGVILTLVLVDRRPAGPRILTCALSGLVLASIAGVGHARVTQGWQGAAHLTADAIHLLAAGAWLGGLIPLGLVINQSEHGNPSSVPLHRTLERFSGMGSLAVAALVVTGVINSGFLVGAIPALWSTPYGRLLSLKVTVFLAMVALAAANRFWLTPAIARGAADSLGRIRALRRHVLGEQVLGLIVVAVVSLLGTLQTAAG